MVVIVNVYMHVAVSAVANGKRDASNVGQSVILPPTFLGCPRDLSRRYLNAITLIQRFGKPDLFVTMTSNPNWPEIKAELDPGEKAQDRPDLIACVFRAKLIALKRKLWMKMSLEPALNDKFTCAEIPSSDNPYLRKIVLRHMMRGPCGKEDPSCSCMNKKGWEGKCKYGYPKAFNDTTTYNYSGYPTYRRRDTGHDRCSFNITKIGVRLPVNEIEQFHSGRWVSPCEDAWRIFSFDLYEMIPLVLLLQVHLPNQHSVRFNASDQLEDVIVDSRKARTSLIEFFKMNAAFPNKPKLLYSEFSEHFVWKPSSKTWKERSLGGVVSRLAFVSPSKGERYFLRLLLTHVRGPTSFENMRTVNGLLCATFQEAAIKLGLLSEDDAVEKCVVEDATTQMPQALRRFFATLLIFGNPRDPLALWHKYYDAFSKDYNHSFRGEELKVKAITIRDVERYLEEMGKTLQEFGLESLVSSLDKGLTRTKDIANALDAPIPGEYIEAISTLNSMQHEAFNAIMSKINSGEPGAFFIDGPGGIGKTYLYYAFYASVRQMGKIVLPTVTLEIVASNMITGRTTHSRFKLPLDHSVSIACNVSKKVDLQPY
ncbi:uncharacterized protein LOC110734939 [Chenopodium quinoa]|uniref:uncharacterized protein LOC110734939 n=1 Tax=Chenopodium quinoa TaxID=63459 RepID=UPI000B7804D6|nr:uncharacterized protein LOC110734939 [Chenopodium quinoa]